MPLLPAPVILLKVIFSFLSMYFPINYRKDGYNEYQRADSSEKDSDSDGLPHG